MKIYDTIIIGAGASGSMSAIMLAQKGQKVAVIDKNISPAKKLLVTGNGRCNITNINCDNKYYNTTLTNYFNKFDNKKTLEFFKSIGVYTYADEEGRCYPISNTAKSVTNAICYQFNKLKIDFYGEENFENYTKKENKYYINLKNETICSKNLIIAVGGNFNDLNLKFIPSLCALKCEENTKLIDGIRVNNVNVKLYKNNKLIKLENGEILFKDHGISGICIFNISTKLARINNFNAQLIIDLLPQINENEVINIIKNQMNIFDISNDILTSILPEKLSNYILKNIKLLDINCKTLNQKNIELIVKNIKEFSLNINGFYPNNQVYSGGVNLESLTENLESKSQKNLYYCGEVCNVDAECGGYNLQWAWTSGAIVANAIVAQKG